MNWTEAEKYTELILYYGTSLEDHYPRGTSCSFKVDFNTGLKNYFPNLFQKSDPSASYENIIELAISELSVHFQYPNIKSPIGYIRVCIEEISPSYLNNERDTCIAYIPYKITNGEYLIYKTDLPKFHRIDSPHHLSQLSITLTTPEGYPIRYFRKEELFIKLQLKSRPHYTGQDMASFYWSCDRDSNKNNFTNENGTNADFRSVFPLSERIVHGEWEVALTHVTFEGLLGMFTPFMIIAPVKNNIKLEQHIISFSPHLLLPREMPNLIRELNKKIRQKEDLKNYIKFIRTPANRLKIRINSTFSDNPLDYIKFIFGTEKQANMMGVDIVEQVKSGEDRYGKSPVNIFRELSTTLLLCSDLVKCENPHDPYKNVLATINVDYFENPRSHSFIQTIPLYKMVSSGFLSSCRFWLLNPDGTPFGLPSEFDNVIVSMHFRQKTEFYRPLSL